MALCERSALARSGKILHCIYPERHKGACEYKSRRWIAVRAVVRVAFMLTIVTAFMIAGSITEPPFR